MSTAATAATWPRHGVHRSLDGVTWFVPSKSNPGAYRRVQWWTAPNEGIWFTCSCPNGQTKGRIGSNYERPCSHVRQVLAAEDDDGHPPRPTPPTNTSALVD